MNEIANLQTPEDFFEDLFDFSDADPVDTKKTSIASNFCALIHHVGISRTELAEKLCWKPSRVSKVLDGSQNMTIKTMVELAVALDYDFDIHFHKINEHRSLQPWEDNLLTYCLNEIEVKMIDIPMDIHRFKSIHSDSKNYQVQTLINEDFNRFKTKSLLSEA